ncbi:tRNA (N6-threonylcarbamoyladenosine(37)-N6)-methyltransferase TrmO [candidate division KSB1 bacterium]
MIEIKNISITLILFLIFNTVALYSSESFFRIYPIGKVKRSGDKTYIEVLEKYKAGLSGLDEFSHVTVVYWFDKNDNPEKRNNLITSRKSKGKNVGVFGTHSPFRPNLIAISHCRILSIEDNIIYIDEIDAFDDSPVIDLKCFIPYTYDKKDEIFKLPDWVKKLIENKNKKK